MKSKLKFITSYIVVYILGILTACIFKMIMWQGVGLFFGKKVEYRMSIEAMALKDGVILKDFINSSGHINKAINKQSRNEVIITQEYPSSQGYNYQQSINLSKNPAVMKYQDSKQPFWLAINNERIKNLINPTVFLNFHGKMEVKADKDSLGWIETDPNFTYFLKAKGSIQPSQGARLGPLFIKFPKEGLYNVSYSITSDNEIPVHGEFNIKVE